jgi:hypothetical protein
MHTKFQPVNLKSIDHLEDLGVDGTKILKYILKEEMGRYWRTHLAQDRGQC